MNCPKCNNEAWLDHIEEKDGKTSFFYACRNPQCPEYQKAYTPTGVEGEAQIKEANHGM